MFLYLLQFEDIPNKFKLGKSSRPHSRFRELELDFGYIDGIGLVEYSIEDLEYVLHRSFKDYREPESSGNGKTEFFSINCFRNVVDQIMTKGYDFDIQVQPKLFNAEVMRLDKYKSTTQLSSFIRYSLSQFYSDKDIVNENLHILYNTVVEDTSKDIILEYLLQ